jgi:hypothetical protein
MSDKYSTNRLSSIVIAWLGGFSLGFILAKLLLRLVAQFTIENN